MIEEAIIHVGMHKTGSSSIQETFSGLSIDNVEYLSLGGSANHSEFFGTILSDKPEDFHPNLMNGRDADASQQRKNQFSQNLDLALSQSSARRVLISAELLSASWVTTKMLDTLRLRLENYCRKLCVIGYVRPPVAYMQSAFQQRLKGGQLSSFAPASLYPGYRERFEKLDVVFGRDAVSLFPFMQTTVSDFDVVKDFGRIIGVDVGENAIVRANESLSLEAVSLLYVFRKFVANIFYDGFTLDNDRLIQMLSKIGGNKFLLASKLVRPILRKNQADIDWIEDRLGKVIEDFPSDSECCIGSEQDLLTVATDNREKLLKLLEEYKPQSHHGPSVADLMEHLRVVSSSGRLTYRAGQYGRISSPSDLSAVFRDSMLEPEEMLKEVAALFSKLEPKVAEGLRLSSFRAKRKMDQNREGSFNGGPSPLLRNQ